MLGLHGGLFEGSGFGFSIICPVFGLGSLVCLPVGYIVLVTGGCPFPMFGEVLSVFRFLWEPVSCNCCLLWGIALLEINS